ncbi:MAG: RMD1 family protein [Pseudomonadota bacterium]|nr:RMD1 family protein [Pseudomonadota bacterium]
MSLFNVTHCKALCFAETFNLSLLNERLKKDPAVSLHRFSKLLFVTHSSAQFEMAIFEYGSVVFWSCATDDVNTTRQWLNRFAKTHYPNTEMEQFFVVSGVENKVYGKSITLATDNMATKIAISYALAQAVKLNQYENTVEKTMSELEHIPVSLYKTGRIPISRHQALKKTGQIFVVKSQINLHSDLIDTPDYFWDRPECEKIYIETLKEMDMSIRISNLNRRLDIMKNLYELLSDHIQHSHSILLEVTIVILISFEIILSLASIYLGKFHV